MKKIFIVLFFLTFNYCGEDCPDACWIPASCSESGEQECSYDSESNCCITYTDPQFTCIYLEHCNVIQEN